jgi:hypothetical protein
MSDSKSFKILLKHGLGDHAIKSGELLVKLPFDIEAACRELDAELESRDAEIKNMKHAARVVYKTVYMFYKFTRLDDLEQLFGKWIREEE